MWSKSRRVCYCRDFSCWCLLQLFSALNSQTSHELHGLKLVVRLMYRCWMFASYLKTTPSRSDNIFLKLGTRRMSSAFVTLLRSNECLMVQLMCCCWLFSSKFEAILWYSQKISSKLETHCLVPLLPVQSDTCQHGSGTSCLPLTLRPHVSIHTIHSPSWGHTVLCLCHPFAIERISTRL